MIAAEAKVRNMSFKAYIKAIEDEFIPHGSISELNEKYGFTPQSVASEIERVFEFEAKA